MRQEIKAVILTHCHKTAAWCRNKC